MNRPQDEFLEAYRKFRESVDFSKTGRLPDPEHLVWYLLMPCPSVPADEEPGPEAALLAVDQRLAILKAVFVEVNRREPDAFLDRGLAIYDEAAALAKALLSAAEDVPQKAVS